MAPTQEETMEIQNRIAKLQDALGKTEPEVRSEFQGEIEKLKSLIRNQEHALRVNRLTLSTLIVNDVPKVEGNDTKPE